MQTDIVWIDVAPFLGSGTQPVHVLDRGGERRDAWVPQAGLIGPEPPYWARTGAHSQFVRVPITAYRTRHPTESALVAASIEIGLAAAGALRSQTEAPLGRATLVMGHACTPLGDAYRFYLGLILWADR